MIALSSKWKTPVCLLTSSSPSCLDKIMKCKDKEEVFEEEKINEDTN